MFSPLGRPASICFAAALIILPIAAFAQQPKVMAPHEPIAPKVAKAVPLPPAVADAIVAGPWMIDANFKSTIHVKNIVETSAITVTPVLYLANGAKYALAPLTIEPAGTAVLDVNAALQAQGIAPYATLTGDVELQYTWPWVPICAVIKNIDTAHSLIFGSMIQSSVPAPMKSQNTPQFAEGLWWKQEPNVTGFMTLSNITSQPVVATVQISDNQAGVIGTHTLTISPHGTKTLAMQELQSASATEGGIRVSYAGPSGALMIYGGLEDQSVGYSAALNFITTSRASVLPAGAKASVPITLAQLGLMTGPADPMMRLPAGTTFTPYSVLRNISSKPISVVPTIWYMQGGAAASAQLPQFTLVPYQTRSLDLVSALSSAGLKSFTGSFNLSLDTAGASGLLVSAGSVDQKNTYVFEVVSRAVVNSAGKSFPYWSTANGDDTMVTVWNPADEAQDYVFRLIFSGGHYNFPVHLGPKATQTFNVSQIIDTQVPDAEGNIIPASVQDGSMKIVGSQADNQAILVAMDSGIYNAVKATCGPPVICWTCDGWTQSSVRASPFGVAVSNTNQLSWTLTWDTGQQYDYTSTSGTNWNSSATNVATVQTGLVRGVSAGSANVTASTANFVPAYAQIPCGGPDPCPVGGGAAGSSPGTTFDLAVLEAPTYIFVGTDPEELPWNRFKMTNSAGTADPQPTGGTCCAASSDTSDAISQVSQHPPTFQFETLDQSAGVGDRTLTFEYDLNGQGTSVQKNVTAREFAYLINDSPSNQCTTTYGTLRQYTYTVYTHPDKAAILPSDNLQGVAVSENFNPPLTCQTVTKNGTLDANGQIGDTISSGCSNTPLTCTQTSSQSISVAGYGVRTNTLQWTSSGVNYTNNGPTQ